MAHRGRTAEVRPRDRTPRRDPSVEDSVADSDADVDSDVAMETRKRLWKIERSLTLIKLSGWAVVTWLFANISWSITFGRPNDDDEDE